MSHQQQLKTDSEVEAMRTGGRINASVLQFLADRATAGITSKELAGLAADELKKLGGQPAFLGYQGYPDVVCISINEEVQHTIPGDRTLRNGDIINFDFGVKYDGLITDAGITVGVGQISTDASRLIEGTRQALDAAIDVVSGGVHVGEVSDVIERVLKAANLGIVEDLMGHGVGHKLHEEPGIPNYYAGRGPILRAGMTIAIEPIANLGAGGILLKDDNWTFITADGSWSSQFEHTILVTETGAEVLTQK